MSRQANVCGLAPTLSCKSWVQKDKPSHQGPGHMAGVFLLRLADCCITSAREVSWSPKSLPGLLKVWVSSYSVYMEVVFIVFY